MLETRSGIPTWTVTGMLDELQVDHLPPGGVLVVDEAGMIGDRSSRSWSRSRPGTTPSWSSSATPSQLQHRRRRTDGSLGEHIGRVLVTENVRQKEPWERAALQLVRDGEARAAYDLY